MHNKMAERVLRAKILFFDSNPIGRILTHFSKDMVSIDFVIAMLTPIIAYGFFRALSVAVSLCIVNPWMIIPLILAGAYMVYILKSC
jgi:ABC-type multidrug transport system fused ATPase/permease subunit